MSTPDREQVRFAMADHSEFVYARCLRQRNILRANARDVAAKLRELRKTRLLIVDEANALEALADQLDPREPAPPKPVTCPDCAGLGYLPDACLRCNGEGTLRSQPQPVSDK
jgi:hypothetical protein